MDKLMGVVVCVSVALAAGCANKATVPGAAVGDLGAGLAAHANSVPRGAEACALEEGFKRQAGDQKKCDAELARDQLWGTSLDVLGAYSRSLQSLAHGTDPAHTGKLEAELTLVREESFVDVEGEDEEAARKAAHEIVTQMQERDDDAKIESVIQEAAPRVQTLCDGLLAYLGEQEQRFAALNADIDTKLQASPGPPRCTNVGGQSVCVGNSVLDYLNAAEMKARLTDLTQDHEAARNSVAAFCVAHYTAAQDAEAGDLKGKESYAKLISAVHNAIPVGPATSSAEASK
jgi:hypothetical protein